MTTLTLEPLMPDPQAMTETAQSVTISGAGIWGTIAASVLAALGVLYTLWGKLVKSGAETETETEALKLVNAAVEKWKELHDIAWQQVVKERELRELAERRAADAVAEVEGLRGEVAALKRQIEQLTAQVTSLGAAR